MRKPPHGCYWRGDTLWGKKIVRGERYRWSLRTDDPKIAKQRYAAETGRLVGAAYFGEHRRTFTEVYADWATWIATDVSPSTVKRYAVSLGMLEPFLSGRYLDEVTGKLVVEIIRSRQAGGTTNATIRRDLGALSSVMNFAKQHEWITDNPVPGRLDLARERRDPIVLPKPEDVARIIARAPGMLKDMIRAAVATGCRQDELVSARRSQLDLTAKTLTVVGKGNKLRVVDLVPFGGIEIFSALPVGDLLFSHGNGERYNNVATQFTKLAAALARKHTDFRRFRFHDLRHLHAVEWLRSGRTIYDLQKRLGHASINVTEGYCKFLTPDEERIAKAGHKIGHSATVNIARNTDEMGTS
jgi:integrase/recombinase XerD